MGLPVLHRLLPGTDIDPLYPDSDGKPVGETGLHVECLLYLKAALNEWFRRRRDIYVAADMFLYYEEGNPQANKSPDIMVVKGVGSHQRRTVKTWQGNPSFPVMIELVSRRSWREDLFEKRDLYARLGVAEYFLYDPEDKYIEPQLQGFRLQGSEYVPLVPEADGGLTSTKMRVRFVPEGMLLRVVNARTGQPILTAIEKQEELERMQGQAASLEEEVARLRKLLGQKPKKKRP